MKPYQRILILVCILLAASACILPGQKKSSPIETKSPVETESSIETKPPVETLTPTETITQDIAEDMAATETIVAPTQVLDPCTVLNLSPEECSNNGTHVYDFKTEFNCPNTDSQKTEKITITFSDSSVEVHKIEPVDEEWTYEFEKISENVYVREGANENGEYKITLEFVLNGFTTDTTVSSLEPCGKYIRTIISE